MTDPAVARAFEVPHDPQLLRQAARGSEDSFRALYRNHTPSIYRLALRLCGGRAADAEEVVQETWRRAISGASSFQGRGQVRAWLKGIAARVGYEMVRRNQRSERDASAGQAVHPGSSELRHGPTGGRPAAEGRAAVQIDLARAVADLAPGYRAVLVLHDVEGFRHTEIAQLLGISPGTSKSQLSRARKQIRNALGESYASE